MKESTIMIRSTIFAVLVAGLFGFASPSHAGVSVNIGINLGAPPPLVAIPGVGVQYAPSLPDNYFFYGGQYYVFYNGGWFGSRYYNGPWIVVAPEYVPRPILAVPIRYYHRRPPEWAHWHRSGPPHWAPAWGRRAPVVRHGPPHHNVHRGKPLGHDPHHGNPGGHPGPRTPSSYHGHPNSNGHSNHGSHGDHGNHGGSGFNAQR
jgi:hypothetical protein